MVLNMRVNFLKAFKCSAFHKFAIIPFPVANLYAEKINVISRETICAV